MLFIFVNAVIVGLETYPELYIPYQEWFYIADRVLLWIFTVEIVLRLISSVPFYTFFQERLELV